MKKADCGQFIGKDNPCSLTRKPCCRTFKCTAPHHVGSRSVPWCCGADNEPVARNWCDECWATSTLPESPELPPEGL